MNVRERLKEAYENVSFSADKTWTNAPNPYQKINMELCLTEHQVQINKLHRNRPRTVRECIPKSRLAQYANYVYNESREMSYASSTSNADPNLSIRIPTEPWEMPEVGELYRWFLKNQPEDRFSRLEGLYESPLLNVNGFEDKILKIQITEDRVKNIWNKTSSNSGEHCTRSSIISVNVFASPLNKNFLFKNDSYYNHEWFRTVSVFTDVDQVEELSQAFKEQNNSISKFLSGDTEPGSSTTEQTSTEILYSEVLQGLSPSRKLLSSLKSDHGKTPPTEETSSVSQESFTNYTVLNSQKSVQEEVPKTETFNFPKVCQFAPVPQFSNKCVPQKTSTTNVYLQTDAQSARCKHSTSQQVQVDPAPRQSRISMIHPTYVQQTYFYPPVQTVQRWVPSNFSSYYPTQVFTSNWFTQNPAATNVNRILGPSVNASGENREILDVFNRRTLECERTEDNQFKEEPMEVEPCVEDNQVSTSISEDLEIQALEQYSSSNENFYQDLERQAAEQYATSPE